MDTLKDIYDYLVLVQVHPLVTLVCLFVTWLGREKWAKEDDIKVLMVVVVSVFISGLCQVAIYDVSDRHGVSRAVVFGLVQSGIAYFAYSIFVKIPVADMVAATATKWWKKKEKDNGLDDPTGGVQ